MWCTSHTPTGVDVLQIIGNKAQSYYAHDSSGYVVPSPDGNRVYTARGYATTSQLQIVRSSVKGGSRLPAVSGTYELMINQADGCRLSVALAGKDTPLLTLPDKFDIPTDEGWARHDFTFDKRINFVPAMGFLAIVPSGNREIQVHRFDLKSALS